MAITRDQMYKRSPTGAKRHLMRKKRKYLMGRQPTLTKLRLDREKVVRPVRCRGGLIKRRALCLNSGAFSWGTEGVTRSTRILRVVYNAQSNELVRTNTLVKGAIVEVDAAPFIDFYQSFYGETVPTRKQPARLLTEGKTEDVLAELAKHRENRHCDPAIIDQLSSKRVLARISTRPGQMGRADGYILDGPELQFYQKKLKN